MSLTEYKDPGTEVVEHRSLVERAIDAGAPLEMLEKLVELQERQEARQAKKAYDAARARAQSKLPKIIKGKPVYNKDGSLRYRHETLTDVTEAVRDILGEEGLSYRWTTSRDARDITVTCIISHRDGYSEETSLPGMIEGPQGTNNVQALGSTITFLQRYTLKAALGIAAGEDTDGVAPKQAQQAADDPEADLPATDAEIREVEDMMEQTGADVEKFLAYLGVEHIGLMRKSHYRKGLRALARKLKEQMEAA